MSTLAVIGLGANLGDPQAALDAAERALAALPGTVRLAASPRYRTAPVDAHGPDFVNAAVLLRTELSAHDLLAALQAIEAAHGRARPYRNAPRTLDLDLLLYGEHRIDTPGLVVPHPRLHERAFALRPLVDVWPDAVLPGRGRAADHLAHVAGQAIERLP